MGCAPSTHTSETGATVDCDNIPTGNHSGVQGHFRTTGSQEPATTPLRDVPDPARETPEQPDHGNVFADLIEKKENQTIKFGPMCLKFPRIKVLFVFAKEDAQSRALRWAADKLHYDCTIVNSSEEARAAYAKRQHHLVVIDTRQQSDGLDSIALCRSLRSVRGSQFTCIVAVVKKSLGEKEEASVVPLLKAGFNRWLLETCSLGVCLNELIQLEHNEIITQLKLHSAQALFAALDCCRDSIMVTGPQHDIQFVNRPTEKVFGSPVTDIVGKNAQDLHKSDTLKSDVLDLINKQLNMGKEWEGTLFHKKKTGENIPLWSRIIPVEFHQGIIDYLIYVKDMPHYPDKTDADSTPYNNMKTVRKTSYDVRSLCSDGRSGITRRQSFAKFHAMTIEAPITKVINMLVATQETSPMPIVQAIDKVLDILRSTELYSPQFSALNQNHMDDQVTSDLVSGLIAGNKSALRKMSHELLLRGTVPQTPTSSQPNLATAPFEIKTILEKDADWALDIMELERLSNRRPLIWLGMVIFARFNVCSTLNCDEATLHNWLSLIEANYHSNPYHNSTHAADVMQATAYFLQNPKIKTILNPLDEAICLIAAVVHDVDHPGKNSAFLCNSGSQLAILYNDLSVLESHHAASAFKLTTSSEKVNILKNLDEESYRGVRQSIIDMVLATEMTKHFEHVSKFVNIFNKSIPPEDEILEDENNLDSSELDSEVVVPVKRMLIKCADISNPARPWKLCVQWAERIAQEYCSQTDEEKRLGLPVVMPAFDRTTCSIPKSQMSFMDFFVNDMFDAWDVFGNFPELMEQVKLNYENWKEEEVLREKQKQAQEQTNS